MQRGTTNIIVATDAAGGIGYQGKLPWPLGSQSTDMLRFRTHTMGCAVIMGRATYDSLGRALPGRTNIVVTRNKTFSTPGVLTARSVEHALNIALALDFYTPRWIIGGAKLLDYVISERLADKLYLSVIGAQLQADSFFSYDSAYWDSVSEDYHPPSPGNHYSVRYSVLVRKQ